LDYAHHLLFMDSISYISDRYSRKTTCRKYIMNLRYVSLIFIGFMSISAHANGQTFKNEPDGFRGIKWGDSIDKFKDNLTSQLRHKDGSVSYEIYNDNMKIGTAKLRAVTYFFFDKTFIGSRILITRDQKDKLTAALKNKFGKPSAVDNREIYVWGGKKQ